MTYKHAFTLTSQIYFCAAPVRLDSYNRCQFACVYCFSRERSIKNAAKGVREASSTAVGRRLDRVASGKVASALDEFLARRVPIQLGGLQDPFSPMEGRREVTLRLLDTLRDHDFPTLISTKGDLVASDRYLAKLGGMNILVRLSAAGVREDARSKIDVRCGSLNDVLLRGARLAEAGIPVSLRIQPIIPGHEEVALEMIERAASAGFRHVSLEFLKIPHESFDAVITSLSRALKTDFLAELEKLGVGRLGPDYTIGTPWKLAFLGRARQLARQVGVAVGAGDTELIHLSDGGGCCNGSDLFLRDSKAFVTNLSGVASAAGRTKEIKFSDILVGWSPERPVTTYLMTDSRTKDRSGRYSDWQSLLAHRWNGGKGPYSPQLFSGVTWGGRYDTEGFKIYDLDDPLNRVATNGSPSLASPPPLTASTL